MSDRPPKGAPARPLLALLLLALGPPAALPAAAPGGLGLLADDIAAAVAARLEPPRGRITWAQGDRVRFDLDRSPVPAELEWLEPLGPLTDPDTLAAVGRVERPCGRIRVDSPGAGQATPWPGCQAPEPGLAIRAPTEPRRLALRSGSAEPELRGLLELLVAVLPARLERLGSFDVSRPADPLPGLARRPAAAPASPGSGEPDTVLVLSAATQGPRLAVLLEIRGPKGPGPAELVQFSAPAVPEAFWRRLRPAEKGSREIAAASLEAPVLDCTAADLDADGREEVLLLGREQILRAVLGPAGTIDVSALQDLRDLGAGPLRARLLSGALTSEGQGPATRLCFATTSLASGWCWRRGELSPLDGVPLRGPTGLLLARYRPGTSVLDGTLRAPGSDLPVADLGPFLRLVPGAGRWSLVSRPDGSLERLDASLGGPTRLLEGTGDGWVELPSGLLLASRPVPLGEADALRVYRDLTEVGTLPFPGSIVAMTGVDMDGDGRREVAVITEAPGGRTRLSLLGVE